MSTVTSIPKNTNRSLTASVRNAVVQQSVPRDKCSVHGEIQASIQRSIQSARKDVSLSINKKASDPTRSIKRDIDNGRFSFSGKSMVPVDNASTQRIKRFVEAFPEFDSYGSAFITDLMACADDPNPKVCAVDGPVRARVFFESDHLLLRLAKQMVPENRGEVRIVVTSYSGECPFLGPIANMFVSDLAYRQTSKCQLKNTLVGLQFKGMIEAIYVVDDKEVSWITFDTLRDFVKFDVRDQFEEKVTDTECTCSEYMMGSYGVPQMRGNDTPPCMNCIM